MKFKEYPFSELLSNIVDNRGKTCPIQDVGIPLIATNCIKNESLYPVFEKVRYISSETYNNWFRGHPKQGDLIFVCKGSPGRVAWVPDPVTFCIAQDMVAIRADDSKIDPKYLFALLRSKAVQDKIINMHVGTLIPHFKKGDFKNLHLSIHTDIEYQKKIGVIYFDISKKIESNTKTNQTLEQIAQANFKSWFVDFDPAKAKIAALEAGGTQEAAERAAMTVISGKNEAQLAQLKLQDTDAYQQLAQTAALFPAAMQESELGEIPEGWEVKCLNDISSLITKGSTPTKTDLISAIDEPTVPLIKVKDILATKEIDVSNLELISSSIHLGSLKRSILKVNDLLFSIAGTIGRVSVVEKELDNSNCNQAVGIIRLNNPILYWNLVWLSLNSERVQNDIQSKVVQGVQANASLQNLKDIKIVIASKDVMDLYNTTIENLIIKIRENQRESRVLVQLRDSLLPKLLSGEITIPDFENSQKEIAE